MSPQQFFKQFPLARMRRLRQNPGLRRMVSETRLDKKHLIQPLFVIDAKKGREAIDSMPEQFRLGHFELLQKCEQLLHKGIGAVALFPSIETALKDGLGSEGVNPQGLIQRSVIAIKERFPELVVICDVALDPYTSHGQDGILDENGRIDNDFTVQQLRQQARAHADAGVDIVAPSDMMDGRIGVIRRELDASGHQQVVILSYAAKYASAFYDPFRDAVSSASALGTADKRTYQMNPQNSDEALQEVALDISEGADIVMVKPALPYLDVVRRIKDTFAVPTFVYQVSGEYAMMQAAIAKGWLSDRIVMESAEAFVRSGADAILTYFAENLADNL